uniref:Phospholipase-like protein n=1 Tax=Tanacetum cinerariifolium TaxID=118510 RepID=A0A699GRR9_TANCI|nr:hypothetical protein [Tanacetum cinerariifolium]
MYEAKHVLTLSERNMYEAKHVQGVEGEEFTELQNDDDTFTFLIDLGYKVRVLPDLYQVFYGSDSPKKSRGKGSQGKKTVDDSRETIDVFKESEPETKLVKRRSASRRVVKKKVTISTDENIIPDPNIALKLATSKPKLKGVQSLTPAEKEAVDIIQALKESKKTSKRQPGTGGSSEGTGTITGVLDESTVIFATSSEGTSTISGVLDEEKDDKEGDADDKGDDHISDTQDTNDEDVETESDEDEIYKYKIRMRKDKGKEMPNAKVEESGNDDEKDTDAANADAKRLKNQRMIPRKLNFLQQIQYEVPHILSPFMLKVLVSVIFEPTVLTPVQETSSAALVTTLPLPSDFTTPPAPQQTTTLIPTPSIITETPNIIIVVLESDTLTAVQLRVAKLEKDVFELKNIDHSTKTLDTLKPNQGKKTKRRINKETESSKKPSSSKETQKGNAPSKGFKTGKSTSIREPVKEPITEVVMDDVDKLKWNNLEGDCYPFDISNLLPIQGHPWHQTVVADYFFNNDLEYLKSFDPERTYTTSIIKTKVAWYEIVGIEDMFLTLWSTIKHAYDKDVAKGIKQWGERRKLWYRSHMNKFSRHNVSIEIVGIEDMFLTLWSTIKHAYDKDVAKGIKQWGESHKLWYRSHMNKFSKHNVYSIQKILCVESVSVKKLQGYGHLRSCGEKS